MLRCMYQIEQQGGVGNLWGPSTNTYTRPGAHKEMKKNNWHHVAAIVFIKHKNTWYEWKSYEYQAEYFIDPFNAVSCCGLGKEILFNML